MISANWEPIRDAGAVCPMAAVETVEADCVGNDCNEVGNAGGGDVQVQHDSDW